MALGGTAQPATTATSKSFAEHPSKQLIGKYLMEDVKAALAFVHSRASLVLRSMNCRSCPASLMTSQTSREAWECLKADAARLVTCPVFWLLLLLGGISCAVASAAALLWVICAPLILRNSDFQTWALREDPEKFKGKVVWVTGESGGWQTCHFCLTHRTHPPFPPKSHFCRLYRCVSRLRRKHWHWPVALQTARHAWRQRSHPDKPLASSPREGAGADTVLRRVSGSFPQGEGHSAVASRPLERT